MAIDVQEKKCASIIDQYNIKRSFQRFSPDGRIYVSRKGWMLRITMISLMTAVTAVNIWLGILKSNELVVYSSIIFIHAILILVVGWIYFRNPAEGNVGTDLVSIIIPIFNQKDMIEVVIDAIHRSTYKNIEILAINDGSTDGTKQILDRLEGSYKNLTVIHQINRGKRKSVAAGFKLSKGKYIVVIDSDSVVIEAAIEEIVKTFTSNPEIGAVSGHLKAWNASKNFLTKMQDAWYDYSYNIHRTTESVFGSVMCCPGGLSGYRREAISEFINYWAVSKFNDSDDRILTSLAYAPVDIKKTLASSNEWVPNVSGKLLSYASRYDDAEDRVLTCQSLIEWKTAYVPTALSYTDVPETLYKFSKQLLRWKKGYVRTSLFVSSFFWKKSAHFFMKLLYYVELMTMFTAPLVMVAVYLYEPIVLGEVFPPIIFTIGIFLSSLAYGIDYRYRDPGAKYWLYHIPMGCFSTFFMTWLLIPALCLIRKTSWLTR
jgi:hyaluronan synthase